MHIEVQICARKGARHCTHPKGHEHSSSDRNSGEATGHSGYPHKIPQATGHAGYPHKILR